MSATPTTTTRARVDTAPARENHAQWCTVVWDDPINTQAYVVGVFRHHFGYTENRARALMLQVHQIGKAIVSTGLRERIEADVYAMHSYGLKATIEPATNAT